MDDEELITSALRRRGATMLCPACSFALRGPVGSYRLVADGDDPSSLGGRHGITLLVYGCANCGYVRLHSANVLGALREESEENVRAIEAHRVRPSDG